MKTMLGGIIVGAAAYRVSQRLFTYRTHHRWERKNYRGRSVSLSGGLATSLALTTSCACLGFITPRYHSTLFSSLQIAGVSSICGYIDDMDTSSQQSKGFHGHLGALKQGHITTGAIKIFGIGSVSMLSALSLVRGRNIKGFFPKIIHTLVGGALIASSANLANLFDLRPGRLDKIATFISVLLGISFSQATSLLAGIVAGVSVSDLPYDVHEKTMNGDTGANALGATIGMACATTPLRFQLPALVLIVSLTVASEKFSFSRIIDSHNFLHFLDMMGRLDDVAHPVLNPKE